MFYAKKITLFLLIVFFSAAAIYPISATAQISSLYSYSYSGIKPFGGKIISMQPCKSPAGIMLNIGGPAGGQFLLTNSSKIFDYGVFAPGVWKLGNASPSTVTCKGKSGLFSGSFAVKMAVSMAVSYGINALFPGIGLFFNTRFDTLPQIGLNIGDISGMISKFGFGKKLDTLGHPHIIQMVGTSLTP